MKDAAANLERQKYEFVWGHDFYRTQADGDPVVNQAISVMGMRPGQSVIDWGCGRGTPAQKLKDYGMEVRGVDIAHNCLNPGVDIPLTVGCIWDLDLPTHLYADYGFCTDVLEHIPPEFLNATIFNIASRTRRSAFIQVCTLPDSSGKKMDPPQVLHLTVMAAFDWERKLKSHWFQVISLPQGRQKGRSAFLCRHEVL